MDHARQQYETRPYPHQIHATTHPLRLAAAAQMAGHTPPDPQTARVLELACATGTNLIAVAASLPQTTCFGIDYAQAQIATANSLRDEVGISNVTFQALDVREFSPAGQFDYILAHGLYTWVPQDVRQAMLRLIRTHLAPGGVAAIGYNTLPGWSQSLAMRHVLQNAFGEEPLRNRPEISHGLLRALTATWDLGGAGAAWAPVGKSMLAAAPMLGYDHFGVVNEPIYLSEFVEQLQPHELQHLGDAGEPLGGVAILPPALRAEIEKLKVSPIQQEQLADLARARSHRISMVIHKASAIRPGNPIAELSLATNLRPGPGELPSEFTTPRGSAIRSNDRSVCAFIATLIDQHEAYLPFTEVVERAAVRINATPATVQAADFPRTARSMLANNMITVSFTQPTSAATPLPDKPVLSRLNRIYAARVRRVVGQSGWSRSIDNAEAALLARLDGSVATTSLGPETNWRPLLEQLARHGAITPASR